MSRFFTVESSFRGGEPPQGARVSSPGFQPREQRPQIPLPRKGGILLRGFSRAAAQLISAGPDGEYGNEDDIVVENGVTYDPVGIYKKRPLKKR